MGAQSDALWACAIRKVKATSISLVGGRSWWLTVWLECGHSAIREYAFSSRFGHERLRQAASDSAKERAIRAETNIKRVGTAPCMACGPDPA